MSPSPVTPLPARARKLRRLAIPTLVTGSLIATAFGTLTAPPEQASAAAAADTRVIGANPIALTQASDPEMGAITPSADAADNGMYGSVAAWPVLPMHVTIARNGHVIAFGTPVNTVAQSGIAFDDWNPTAGLGVDAHTDTASQNGYDSFCNAAVTLMDGRILMVSGQVWDTRAADMMSMIYNPFTADQQMGADLAYKRWYVTALRLPDSRILLLGGAKAGDTGAWQTPDDNSAVAYTPEIGTGTGAWSDLAGAASTELFGAVDNHWWYPRAFNGPNGTVVGTSGDAIWSLDPNGNGAVQRTGTLPFNPKVSGSQVMYAPGKILIAGGGQNSNDDPTTATAQAAILDVNGATPWTGMIDPMHFKRNWLNLTVLPTGEVFANGGTINGTQGGDANSVRQSEIWNPQTTEWRTAATAQMTRTYHSTAVLLPSGSVLTGGGGNPGPVDNFNTEMYYPAYLFTKAANGTVQWASRPAITAISGSATYGGQVQLAIGDGRAIASASLTTLASETHSQNTDQRRIPLAITQQGGTVTATLPDSVNRMPNGDYELTVVDKNGVPSPAQVITIRNGQAGLVTLATGSKNPTAAVNAAAGDAGTGTGTVTGGGNAGGAGNGAGAGNGTGAGTGTTTAPGTKDAAKSTVTLTKGSAVSLSSLAKAGYRVSANGAKVVVAKAGAASAKKLRTSASWIVRAGLGSKKGYSFESVSKPGYYLTAPASGTGALTVAKGSKARSFGKRATFSAVTGVIGRDVSFRLTSSPTKVVHLSGSKVVISRLGETFAQLKGATFTVPKGLAAKR